MKTRRPPKQRQCCRAFFAAWQEALRARHQAALAHQEQSLLNYDFLVQCTFQGLKRHVTYCNGWKTGMECAGCHRVYATPTNLEAHQETCRSWHLVQQLEALPLALHLDARLTITPQQFWEAR